MLNPPQLDGSPRLTPRSERDSRHLNLVMAGLATCSFLSTIAACIAMFVQDPRPAQTASAVRPRPPAVGAAALPGPAGFEAPIEVTASRNGGGADE